MSRNRIRIEISLLNILTFQFSYYNGLMLNKIEDIFEITCNNKRSQSEIVHGWCELSSYEKNLMQHSFVLLTIDCHVLDLICVIFLKI